MTAYGNASRRGAVAQPRVKASGTSRRDSDAILVGVLSLAATVIALWDLVLFALAAG